MRLIHNGMLNGGRLLPVGEVLSSTTPYAENLLWTSPFDSIEGWVVPELEELYWSGQMWELELSDQAKIAKVDSFADLVYLAERFPGGQNVDWSALSREFDAFWLTAKGLEETRYTSPLNLGEFVCETVVVFNSSLLKVIGIRDDLS